MAREKGATGSVNCGQAVPGGEEEPHLAVPRAQRGGDRRHARHVPEYGLVYARRPHIGKIADEAILRPVFPVEY